jgi:homoserine O-succinyltransferase
MPVLLERRRAEDRAYRGPDRRIPALQDRASNQIDVALVNNMPDAALESTERQFMALLSAAAGDLCVRLTLYSLPGVPRAEAGCNHLRCAYADTDRLWVNPPDGLIVTGAEPRTPALSEEPYWASLVRLIDWTDSNGISTVWSCLAAHAAVLHIDGIARAPLAHKRFGLFECVRTADHSLMQDVPDRFRIAHSRWNELPLGALLASGYTILTRSVEAGADAFVKQRRTLALLFQGHPEYDARALLREYRRDVGRFLRGERETYPEMPRGYFGRYAVAELSAYRVRALLERRETLLTEFPMAAVEADVTPVCDSPAVRIYGNWLSFLLTQKAMRRRETPASCRDSHPAPALTSAMRALTNVAGEEISHGS